MCVNIRAFICPQTLYLHMKELVGETSHSFSLTEPVVKFSGYRVDGYSGVQLKTIVRWIVSPPNHYCWAGHKWSYKVQASWSRLESWRVRLQSSCQLWCKACLRQSDSFPSHSPLFKVHVFNRYLNVLLELQLPFAIFWHHRGFWNYANNLYLDDGVHLNALGKYKLYPQETFQNFQLGTKWGKLVKLMGFHCIVTEISQFWKMKIYPFLGQAEPKIYPIMGLFWHKLFPAVGFSCVKQSPMLWFYCRNFFPLLGFYCVSFSQ